MIQFPSSLTLRIILGVMLFLQVKSQKIFSQSYMSNNSIPIEVMTKSIMNEQLWKKSTLNIDDVSTIYILNHGVEAINNIPSNLKIKNSPIVIINKGVIDTLRDSPYFTFHTFNIEESKAFIRIYMSYVLNNERQTNNIEITFIKNNHHWEVKNTTNN